LGFADNVNPFGHKAIKLPIACDSVDMSDGFQPLVAIPIAPVCASVSPFLQPGRDAEVVQLGGVLAILESVVHSGDHRLSAKVELLGPEALRPSNVIQVHAS